MSFFAILETLFIGPLKLIFEIIFGVANRFVSNPGLAIIFLSLAMNILVLPLYRRADAMQEKARDIENKLSYGVNHIKKTFTGDERMMILQTYYRQNHYKPTDALHGSVSLLLEIPFFMAAYQFLSHLEILNGVSFGPIKDLSAPDGLITIGGLAINLLPILMTSVNVISSALYLKGFPLKTKIQLYGMAGFFLVFLYTSPSGLVFYWTLNNLFSLVKTIFYKIKNPQKVLKILTAIIGVAAVLFGGFIYDTNSLKRRALIVGIGVALLMPTVMPILKKVIKIKAKETAVEPNRKIFIFGAMFLTVLIGLFIPTTFIAASPQEYVDISYFHHPLWYVMSAACLAAGTFIVWMSVFYWLASPKGKVIFEKLVAIMCVAMTVNYMFFGTKLGNMSATLQYDNGMSFAMNEQLINIVVIMAIALVMYLLVKKWKSAVASILIVAILALGGMSVVHINTIKTSVDSISTESLESGVVPNFDISTTGQNVVVIMLDRAMGEYLPYIFNEKPELEEQFKGFTYYSNTISFGGQTNFGVPALLGGYEYTPVEMNKRDTELLVDKHNESLKVMPVLFANNGFDVTVCDPVYANYQWIPDLTVFDEYPEIDTYITKGSFGDVSQKETVVANNHRNFFCFSIMKSMPLFLQTTIYQDGGYNKIQSGAMGVTYSTQQANGISNATGMSVEFMEAYNVLASMSSITQIKEENKNTFLFLSNDVTHEPMLLQEPDYVPAEIVDNRQYDANNSGRFNLNGKVLKIETSVQMAHYQANVAALIQLGKWFDYLRENNAYDNTKIIIVADHGQGTRQLEDLLTTDEEGYIDDIGRYFPLFMVKDFNSTEFTTSSEFMTNADVPVLAFKDLIDNPVNPFTGKVINSDEKTAHRQFVTRSLDWQVSINNGTCFLPARWMSVEDDIWDKNDWEYYEGNLVLKEHSAS